MHKNPRMRPRVLWKSDASQVYRCLPMHPCWQVQQATLIDGTYHIDQCAVFGNHASGRLWCLFFRLVCWIGIHDCGIEGLLHYINNAFSMSFSEELSLYKPYGHLMPSNQTCFLYLLNQIGVLHKDNKQFHGESLKIISLVVDLQNMSISMSYEVKWNLIQAVHAFILNMPDNKHQQPL